MTSVEDELLRLLMLHVCAPDTLPPEEIELADRVVERLGAEFTLRQPGVADNPFCLSRAESCPRRAKDAQPAAGTRYFGPGMAYESLQRLARASAPARAECGPAPARLLARHPPDAAPAAHEPASGIVRVLHGHGEVWSDLSRTRNGGELSLAATSPTCRARRKRNLRGASASELLAEVPHESRARVKVGGLVGILSDASEHWVGMIRRLHAQPDGALHAHIEVLSRAPEAHAAPGVRQRRGPPLHRGCFQAIRHEHCARAHSRLGSYKAGEHRAAAGTLGPGPRVRIRRGTASCTTCAACSSGAAATITCSPRLEWVPAPG